MNKMIALVCLSALFTFSNVQAEGTMGQGTGDAQLSPSSAYVKQLIDSAGKGDKSAQYKLGNVYFFGVRVPQDIDQAIRYYKLAADQGHAGAQFALGEIYKKGTAVPKHLSLAAYYYNCAAKQGDTHAAAESRKLKADRVVAATSPDLATPEPTITRTPAVAPLVTPMSQKIFPRLWHNEMPRCHRTGVGNMLLG